MNPSQQIPSSKITQTLLGVGVAVCLGWATLNLRSQTAPSPNPPPADALGSKLAGEITALRAEIEHLKSLVPDQAHAMEDVGYHFANLWFAADKKNWPLADFYLGETRSHLKWAVRIRPVRQTKAGNLELAGILDAVDGTLLQEVKRAIDAQDNPRFITAYRAAIDGCYSCHKASEKPFIRPQVPTVVGEHIINLDPAAEWPK